ncbi:MAG TPA: hypothetical protein VLD37_05980 [Candidatus Bilamarchaeum sp.]|nr:hypothetical protein [Candidatus Bilamarchaeum sp.]
MGRLRVIKRQEKGYVELPPEMASCEEVEIFQLREGYYLLSVPLGKGATAPPREKGQVSEEERAVLRKLLSIRFENRTPAYVGKALSGSELEVLRELEQRRLVNVFRGNKYKDGVYNINDSIYPLLAKGAEQAAPQAHPSDAAGSLSSLNSRGFAIISDKREALALSEQLSSEIKSGTVVGIKGFDGKFYLVTKNYLSTAARAIEAALKEEMDALAIASAAKLEPDGCMAVLRLLAENGEIIEKKRGVFAPV